MRVIVVSSSSVFCLGAERSSVSVDHSLDEISNWGFLVVDEMTGTDAVGGDEDLRVKTGSEQVDGDDRGAFRFSAEPERLAQQHLASLEGGMGMAADGVADDLGGDHGKDRR